MRKLMSVLTMLLLPLGAFAGTATDNSLTLGTRLGAGLFYVVSDADANIYPSEGGLNGSLSFDVAYNLTGNLYLHSGLGLSYLNSFVYEEESSYCCVAPLDTVNDNSSSDGREVDFHGYSSGGYWKYYQSLSLEIPLLVQWRIPGILFLEAGVSVDVIVWSKTHGSMGIIQYKDEDSENVDGAMGNVQHEGDEPVNIDSTLGNVQYKREKSVNIANSFGVNLIAGIGHKFDNGLFIDFRATFRLNDAIDADKFIDRKVYSWGGYEVDGNVVEGGSEDYSEPYGTYYKLLKFQLGVGYWF